MIDLSPSRLLTAVDHHGHHGLTERMLVSTRQPNENRQMHSATVLELRKSAFVLITELTLPCFGRPEHSYCCYRI